jgi:hypothetical protein
MARKFKASSELLHDLLNRYEAGTTQPAGYPDHAGFDDVAAADLFTREIREAERHGGVSLIFNSGRRQGELKLVRLADARKLYDFLRRTPSSATASTAGETVFAGLTVHPAIRDVALAAIEAWSRNRTWIYLGIDDASSMRNAVILAQAIVDGRHVDLDYRTFSRRMVSDSKALERLEGAVLRMVRAVIDLPPSSSARASFATLGLERFSPPLLLSGCFLLNGAKAPQGFSYLGISPSEATRVDFAEQPAYVLTIENFASFNRHILEADPNGRGLTLFVGGYPSLAAQKSLKELASKLPDQVPFFHWSDIDPDGTWIFRTIERAIKRRLRPHLMTRELAEAFGEPLVVPSKLRRGEGGNSMISEVIDYLSQAHAKTMEQEQIDPQIPETTD